jgi:hypothetical protein
MTQPNANGRQGDSWLVELTRVTAFPSPGAQIDGPKWWLSIVGEHPESQLILPKKGTSREEGPFGTGRLILETQPTRIDWVLAKAPDEDSLGEPSAVFKQFTELVTRWFELCGPLQRLAFGSMLSLPVNSRPEGYDKLRSFLKGVELDPENSSDFLYQINRPRMFDAGGFQIKINRLSKWSVRLWQLREISPVSDRLITSAHACSLELDLNTDGEFTEELPRESLKSILDLLIEFGLEISQRGDVQ